MSRRWCRTHCPWVSTNKLGNKSTVAHNTVNSIQSSSPLTTSYLPRKCKKLSYIQLSSKLLLCHLKTFRREINHWFLALSPYLYHGYILLRRSWLYFTGHFYDRFHQPSYILVDFVVGAVQVGRRRRADFLWLNLEAERGCLTSCPQ